MKILNTKKRRSCFRKKLETNESHYSSRHASFFLIWSSLFSSQFLCTTGRIWIFSPLQSSIHCIKLTKIPHTRTNWFVKKGNVQKVFCRTRLFRGQSFGLSTYQTLQFAEFKIGRCRNWSAVVGFCSTTASKKRRGSRHLLYLTLLEYLQLCFWKRRPKPKRGEGGPPSKFEGKNHVEEVVHSIRCCLWMCAQFIKNWQSVTIKGNRIFKNKNFVYRIYFGHMKIQENDGFCWVQKWSLVYVFCLCW